MAASKTSAIPRRDLDFGYAGDAAAHELPRDWCGDSAYASTFLDALSLLFPEGEAFFVRSVKLHRDRITTPALAQAVAGFIGQEAMHGREHRAFNRLVADAHGFPEAAALERRLKGLLRGTTRVLSPHSQLAVTAALEHFTALLAEQLLGDDPAMRDELHPAARPLWLWHALEELEHKAVAFDVYRETGGGELRRLAIWLLTTSVFIAVLTAFHARLLATRKLLWKPWAWRRGATRMFVSPGYLTRIAGAYLGYLRPGFHPDDRDSSPVIARWRAMPDTWRPGG